MNEITADSHVTLHYRIALLADGAERELVNTFSAKPATLQMGAGQWSVHLEQRLLGLAEGAEAQFELPPGQAYGERHPDMVRRVARNRLPVSLQPRLAPVPLSDGACAAESLEASRVVPAQPGETVEITSPDGVACQGTLVDFDGDDALVDFNHPLAGMNLKLNVRIIGVL